MARKQRLVPDRQWRHRYPGEVINLVGQRFGRLTAIQFARRDDYGRSIWLCRCDCKRTKEVRADYLRSGTTNSCGCLRKHMESL